MRIVSGEHKGRVFLPPKSFKARPTTDIAKEGLFNIINNHFDFEEIAVLDLFSGTGSISFEFASRGCESIHLVETNIAHFQFILKVQHELNFTQIVPIRLDAYKFLKTCKISFDIIFADPPYEFKGIEQIPELVLKNKLLNKDGWLIVEHSKRIDLSELDGYWQTRNYGNVHFSFFKQ
ncbi:MAG TPA: 16S rRNA (guanine(966)-N(2))-methyltransferase RsmD [Bacteroidales bacterium]|jgi:16S rRNA (guanine(966)-N(2))-methyltransferase RsmD|nr:16S rRNA (guanine(966)-N(2))-methyltransferase RsmD [Bacteroidales bacterium]